MQLLSPTTGNFSEIRRQFVWQIPEHFNIATAVCDRYADGRGDTAIFWESSDGQQLQASFDQLQQQANRLANTLLAAGIKAGDRIGIILPQRVEAVVAHIACYKLGAIALPLAVMFGGDALEYRLRNSGARVALVDASRREVVESLKPGLAELELVIDCDQTQGDSSYQILLSKASAQFETAHTLANDPALLIYTSGTTGPPKGALVAHRSLIGNLTGFELSQNFFPESNDLMWTPSDWAWTGGLLDALLPSLYYRHPVLGYMARGFDPEKACDLMARYQVTNSFLAPTALKMLRQLGNIRQRYKLQLRGIMSAGEQVGEELIHWGRDILGVTINEMWGQTEFNYLVGNSHSVLPVKPGSMGKPYPGHEVMPIDAQGQPVAEGEVGELAARCSGDPVMFLGYWQNDEATRSKIVGDWFLTGDLGRRDEDGYLWFLGRRDDVISSAGYRIGPGEIEDCLIKHPAIAQAAVIGSPDELRGEIVKAYVVLASGESASPELKKSIQQHVRENLAAYEYPRAITFIDSLPMTTTGKIRRLDLRRLDRSLGSDQRNLL